MYRVAVARQRHRSTRATASVHDLYQSTYLTDARIDGGNGAVLFSANKGGPGRRCTTSATSVVWVATDPNNPNRLYASGRPQHRRAASTSRTTCPPAPPRRGPSSPTRRAPRATRSTSSCSTTARSWPATPAGGRRPARSRPAPACSSAPTAARPGPTAAPPACCTGPRTWSSTRSTRRRTPGTPASSAAGAARRTAWAGCTRPPTAASTWTAHQQPRPRHVDHVQPGRRERSCSSPPRPQGLWYCNNVRGATPTFTQVAKLPVPPAGAGLLQPVQPERNLGDEFRQRQSASARLPARGPAPARSQL